jgi:HD-GYP domain-containing protein (c-di-GMP phosphodiesterase class II)
MKLLESIGCDVIEKQSAKDAITLLQILPDIDLVICREKIGTEKTGFDISTFLEKEMSSTPILIIGNKITNYNHAKVIDATQPWRNIVAVAGKVMGMGTVFDESRVTSDYVPVGIHYFSSITSASICCDVYIRIKKDKSDYQYVKRLHASDQFSREDIVKYKESGLKDFYISKENFNQFVNFVTADLIGQLGNEKLASVDRILLSSEAYEVTLDRIHSLGIDNYTIEMVEKSIQSMEISLRENNNLTVFLKTLKDNQLSFAYAHSYLSCLILHKIVVHFDWESVQVLEKLTYVAYFHDISLKNISLMKINALCDLDNSDLSDIDKKLINNHALQSAAIIERFPKLPIGIAGIIKEHHGSKSGVGFPENLSTSIAPISMMFVVVENFVDEFLKIKGVPTNEDFIKIFANLGNRYNSSIYQQTLVALQNMTQSKKKPAN